jgi:hypothetical protein
VEVSDWLASGNLKRWHVIGCNYFVEVSNSMTLKLALGRNIGWNVLDMSRMKEGL